MQYILLIYEDPSLRAKMTDADMAAEMNAYNAFTVEVRNRGAYVSGEALHPATAATTVRVRQGKTLTTDGPFAETREHLGGFYIVECKDLDEAIAIAAKIPGAQGGSIEVRPVAVFN